MASFEGADVAGAPSPELAERLLGQAMFQSLGAQVAAEGVLNLAAHTFQPESVLLMSLLTYK